MMACWMVFFGLLVSGMSWGQDLKVLSPYQNDFKRVFNQSYAGLPNSTPWAGSWWSYSKEGLAFSSIHDQRGESPAERFDAFRGFETESFQWERDHHSCLNVAEEEKEDCHSWWGHCHAWAAAAIKEKEPEGALLSYSPWTGLNHLFSVADQKGYLTEQWMKSHSLFAGSTDKTVPVGEWIFHSDDKISQSLSPGGKTRFDTFWDMTPRAFFRILTHYMGHMKTGLVIDRFSGHEVWNQPLVGYRFLPIQPEDIHPPIQRDGQRLYPLSLRVKIFWAEDNVWEGTLSANFDRDVLFQDLYHAQQASYRENGELAELPYTIEYDGKKYHHFSGRYLQFKLYFDGPVTIDEKGMVLTAGELRGPGLWHHQEYPEIYLKRGAYWYSQGIDYYNHLHPDFMWLPTQISYMGGLNPEMDPQTLRKILAGEEREGVPMADLEQLRSQKSSLEISKPVSQVHLLFHDVISLAQAEGMADEVRLMALMEDLLAELLHEFNIKAEPQWESWRPDGGRLHLTLSSQELNQGQLEEKLREMVQALNLKITLEENN